MSEVLERWATEAGSLVWARPWDQVCEGSGKDSRWFPGGELNAAVNCLDRHLPDAADRVALYWEGEPGDRRAISYGELHREVCALSLALATLGVTSGDRVAIYMAWLPETVSAMLAAARLGAAHLLIPAALPIEALAERLAQTRPKILVTQDAAWRHGALLPLKARADDALAAVTSVEHTVVVRRAGLDVETFEGDIWYDDLLASVPPERRAGPEPVAVPASHPLLVAHTVGRRSHPVALVHGTGGFLAVVSAIHRHGLTLSPSDVLWCASEIAWAAGVHGVYGPLLNGATTVAYEGMLDTPTHARLWEIIERYSVNALTTTPSVVRKLRKWLSIPDPAAVESLGLVVTAGERLDGPTRTWLAEDALRGRAELADGWGQWELGGIVDVSRPDAGPVDLPGLGLDVAGPGGQPMPAGQPGDLIVRNPWPGMYVSAVGDAVDHWEGSSDVYVTGDVAYRNTSGAMVILGRKDPLISVSGQLVSLTEVSAVLAEHPFVAEVEVIRVEGFEAPVVVACVVLQSEQTPGEKLSQELLAHVQDILGGLARPHSVVFVESFPPELESVPRRAALARLCAGLPPAEVPIISTDQLLSAAAIPV